MQLKEELVNWKIYPESYPECSITERQEMNKMKKVKRFGG